MSLARSFPPEERLESFNRQFVSGVVIRLFCDFTRPPKEKRLLIINTSSRPHFFVINSEINEFKQDRRRLLEQQVLLEAAEYEYLDHDSYVDCSRVWDEFMFDEIKQALISDPGRILGHINSRSAGTIMTVVDDSSTLEPRQKELVISTLNVN